MTTDRRSFVDEIAAVSERLLKGYENLRNTGEIKIAQTPKTEVWCRDKVKLFHYNRETAPKIKTPVLISYALVNRQDMLDLQPDRSLVKNLLDLGLDLYIMDWGYPTQADKYLTMDDYINGYLDDTVDFIREQHGIKKIDLMGICQGGTFSAIYAALHPEKIKNLVTIVTPIDFSTNDGLLFKWSKDMNLDALVDGYGTVPGEFLNTGFALLKPMMQAAKFRNLVDIIDHEDKLLNYLRMEKWINDSPNQAGECFRQFLKDLYQQNKLVKGTLVIGDKKVNLKNITMPLLNIYATEDHLVPPASVIPFNDYVGSKDKELYKFSGGHIGVFVGNRTQKELGPAIEKWLDARDK
jgi:polyhydroxyalkanoate synthase subunit PhaC